jgi:hypothetical protein
MSQVHRVAAFLLPAAAAAAAAAVAAAGTAPAFATGLDAVVRSVGAATGPVTACAGQGLRAGFGVADAEVTTVVVSGVPVSCVGARLGVDVVTGGGVVESEVVVTAAGDLPVPLPTPVAAGDVTAVGVVVVTG